MSDIDIRGGGIVAVDTDSLAAAARTLDSLRADVTRVSHTLASAASRLGGISDVFGGELVMRAWFLEGEADALQERPEKLASGLRDIAAMYEIVELRAQRAAAEAAGDAAALARIEARIGVVDAAHPWAQFRATMAEAWRTLTWQSDLVGQMGAGVALFAPTAAAAIGLAAWGLTGSLRAAGAGRIGSESRLSGQADPVQLRTVGPAQSTGAAPQTLAGAAARIPDGAARVRVELYAMPDGSRQFAVYVAGTRTVTAGGPDPFDMGSNVELYTGEDASSYAAVVAALADAGAEPGDVVHAFGHSQGALVASHLAVEGGFDTRTLVGFGSPVATDVGEGTLSVTVRHTDDPVAALAAGGSDAPVGASGSFVAERSLDPGARVEDLSFTAHHMTGYVETAGILDGSSDPRMDAVRDTFAELGTATSVVVTEYDSVRVRPSGGGGE